MERLLKGIQCLMAVLVISISGFSQGVAFNTTLAPANPSAGLDIDFPAQGFLIPRVALTGLNLVAPLTAHVAGMMLYNTATATGISPGIYFNDGSKWVAGERAGAAFGDMQYWNGSAWTVISGGIAGQYLTIGAGGVPVWSGNASGYATLTTSAITNILANTATGGGNITNDGGFAVTARGVCWGTAPAPTIAGSKTINGSGSGAFVSALTGLSAGTLYYVRAYATNGLGTVYGNETTFTTN